mgnify:CR=1 FL=1
MIHGHLSYTRFSTTLTDVTLTGRRNAFEFLRDAAAEHFEQHTGSAWRPRAGSMVSRRTMTAAMIDSRDFLTARRRVETDPLLPGGARIVSPTASMRTACDWSVQLNLPRSRWFEVCGFHLDF